MNEWDDWEWGEDRSGEDCKGLGWKVEKGMRGEEKRVGGKRRGREQRIGRREEYSIR